MDFIIKEKLVDLALHEFWDAVTAKVSRPEGIAVLTKDETMMSGGSLKIKADDSGTKNYTYPAAETLNANLVSHLCKTTDERPLPNLKDILQAVAIVTPHKGTTLGYTVRITENPENFSGLVDPPGFQL